jgi:hypothetical protein
MSAYISYSDEDTGMITALRLGLQGQGVNVQDRSSMEGGGSRRDQLKKAIGECDVCIFLATQHSIESDWCKVEVGAFWGAGKGVIVFVADPSVTEEHVPPHLQEDIRHKDFGLVVRDVKKIIFEAEERRKKEAARRPKMVGEMSIASLYDALTSLRSSALDGLPVGEAMRLIHENITLSLADEEAMKPLISRLVGVPRDVIEQMAGNYWPTPFRLTTDTGEWVGFAKKFASRELTREYSNCLLILYDVKCCVAAVAANSVVEREYKIVCDGLIENAGGFALGEPKQLSGAGDA